MTEVILGPGEAPLPQKHDQKIERSLQIGKLVSALAKAQVEFDPVLKDTKNPFYSSMYADLADVVAATQSALSKNELVIIQLPTRSEKDAGVVTLLAHSSGEWISSELILPATSKGKDGQPKFDAQSIGSAITYARRYAYQAMIGAAAEQDQDGNSLVDKDQRPDTKARTAPVAAPSKVSNTPATERSQSEPNYKWQPSAEQTVKAVAEPQVNSSETATPTESLLYGGFRLISYANGGKLPDTKEFREFTGRAKKLSSDLVAAGAKASAGRSVSEKLKTYLLSTTGMDSVNKISVNQWSAVLELLEKLILTDPKKCVSLIDPQEKVA